MGEKKNVTYWFLWTWVVRAEVRLLIRYVFPDSLCFYLPSELTRAFDSIMLYVRWTTVPLKTTAMAHDALINNKPDLQLYGIGVTLALSLCGQTGYQGTSLRASHSTRAYADTRAQHPATSYPYRTPSACFASISKLILLLLYWNKSGGKLAQHEQFWRSFFFFSFWKKQMHLTLGLSNYHPTDTRPCRTWHTYFTNENCIIRTSECFLS
jgi:hypothetical protein